MILRKKKIKKFNTSLLKENQKKYKCEICLEPFTSGSSKGGHMSRVHPKESEEYKKKLIIRKSNEYLREIRKKAVKRLVESFGHNFSDFDQNKSRKKQLKEIKTKNKTLFNKYLEEENRIFNLENFAEIPETDFTVNSKVNKYTLELLRTRVNNREKFVICHSNESREKIKKLNLLWREEVN